MFRPLFVAIIFSPLFLQSCTKLDETFQGDLTSGGVGADTLNTAALLQGVYNALENTFTDHLKVFPLEEFTTDEAILPTRGSDWDDNGGWRVFHEQKWDADNSHISGCFNALNGIIYAATDMLRYHPTIQQQAEARFIRAWVMYLLLDMFDQVPYRDPGESDIDPARVRSGMEAFNYIISEVDSVENDLPDGPRYVANKYAAKVLLMKCYLNKAVFENRENPAPPDPADMNKVISLADEIINSNKCSFTTYYFDNFAPANTSIGNENIFTQLNQQGITPNNYLFSTWGIVLHPNQYPGGLNGFTTLSDFYNKFEPNDKRRGLVYETAGAPPNPGQHINAGFLIGQQYDPFTNSPLVDRTGGPLIYTPEVHNIDTGSNLEVTGIRAIKYVPDYENLFSPDNDLVYFRLSDVLLMKAEAILRHGTPTNAPYGNSASSIINAIRTHPSRGASPLSSVTLDDVFDERGRELWWEGWRREDMIRFEKFLQPFEEKRYTSDSKYLLFPIPNEQLAVNPKNLKQNPGY